ncbi:MAG: chromate transporter [Halofilum sp. (in: g-proteobacteria)]
MITSPPGALEPYTADILASVLATWVTFVACFIWIFLGAPCVEALRGNSAVSATLGGITAAVVGVILNLSVWFGVHVVFASVSVQHFGPLRLWVPDVSTLDPMSFALSVLALLAMLRMRMGMIPVLAASAPIGAIHVLLIA